MNTTSQSGRERRILFGAILVLAVLGSAFVLYQTRYGPGMSGDSTRYLMGAQNLISGNGYTRTSGGGELKPITGFPPVYSIVIAGASFIDSDFSNVARILNAFLFGGNIFLVGLFIHWHTKSLWPSLIGSVFLLVAPNIILVHSWVMAESLYIFLSLLSIYGIVRYIDNNKLPILVFSSVVVCAAVLTRLVGVSLAIAGMLSIVLLGSKDWKGRMIAAAGFGALSLAPVYLWLKSISTSSGEVANREVIFHAMRSDLIRSYFAEIANWITPRILNLPRLLRGVIIAVITVPWSILFIYREFRMRFLEKNHPRENFWSLPWVLGVYVIGYIGVLILNSILFDAGTTLGATERYLTPIYVVFVIFIVIVFHRLLQGVKRFSIYHFLTSIVTIAILGIYISQSISVAKDPIPTIAYTGFKVYWTDTVRGLKAHDPSAPIISNNPELIYILSDRPAYMWPIAFDNYKLQEREDFDQQVEATRDKLENGGILVVIGWSEEAETVVFEQLEAEVLQKFEHSTFYGYP